MTARAAPDYTVIMLAMPRELSGFLDLSGPVSAEPDFGVEFARLFVD